MHFRYFVLSPLRKGCGPLLTINQIPFSKECVVSGLVKIGPVFLEILTFRQCFWLLSPLEKERGLFI